MKRTTIAAALLLGLWVLAGCQYYRVTDPTTGKEYITNNWLAGRHAGSGAARFQDLKGGKEVTIQSSEVEPISEAEAKAAIAQGKGR